MQARYYDPLIGRFYSNDPVGFKNVHNFNRYAYANNNPYKYIDPDGKDTLAIGVDAEAIFPIGGGGQAGGFINYDKGVITIGTFTETKVSAGEDIGISVSIQGSGGGLSDFQGDAVTAEADFGVITIEPGATLDSEGMPNEPIFGVEFGLGLPAAGSGNHLTTTIEDSISIDISPVIETVEEWIE